MADEGKYTDSEELMRFALESAQMGVWDLDPINQLIRWDKRCQQLYGFSKNDVITYHEVLRHIHPLDQEKVDAAVKHALDPTSDGYYYCEFRTIGAEDHKLRWLRCQGKVYFNDRHVAYRFAGTAVDISAEIRTKEQLTQSESRFSNMIAQAPVAIGILRGKNLVVESANEMLLLVWGKTASVIGLPVLEALPEIINQPFPRLLNQVYESGIPHYGYDAQVFLYRNGALEEAYINYVYAPLRDVDQSVDGIMVVAYEVTSQIKSKRELRESELRFKSLIDEAPMATAVYVGEDMRIQLANEAMIKLWGRTSDVIGQPLAHALPELDGQPFLALLHNVYTTGVPYQADDDQADLIIDGKRQSFYFNFTYKPLRNTEGNIYAILNMAVDVTSHVNTRRKIRQAEEQLRIAIEAAQLGTWSVNVATQESHFSERLRDWFGFTKASILAKEGVEAIHPRDRARFVERAKKAVQPDSTGVYEDEYTIVHLQTKQERMVRSVGKAFFDEDGNPYLLIGTVQDITTQKMAEQELERLVQQRTEQLRKLNLNLQQSNQELERFAYIASHDLQEPLRKIQSFSSLLQSEYTEKLGDDGIHLLSRIQSSANRMSLLTKDILNFSRINQQQQHPQLVNLNDTMRDVMHDLDLLLSEKQAEIIYDQLCTLEAIPLQMYQLLYNLISNSLKFSRPNVPPRITISTQTLSAPLPTASTSLMAPVPQCEILVADNGIGFDQKYAQQIFGLFQRLHGKNQYEGTGIGLALCQRIVTNHEGQITAESQEGQGTLFRIILPLRQAQMQETILP